MANYRDRWPIAYVVLLAAYFLGHLLIRVAVSDSFELDESEQALLAQSLRWGYGPQPPLYTWLQLGFFKAFGVNVVAVSLLRNLLLFATYLFVFMSGRIVLGSARLAALASASLLLIPQIAWESQRDLSHSVLLTAVSSATTYALLRALESRRIARYGLLGVLIGLGILAKYNYLLFITALLLAVAVVSSVRQRARGAGLLLALVVAAGVAAPHVAWCGRHLGEVTSSVAKLHIKTEGLWLSWARGILSLGKAAVLFALPFIAGFALCFPRALWPARVRSNEPARAAPRANTPESAAYAPLLGAFLLLTMLVILAFILCVRATAIKDRWLQPLLFLLPLYLFSRVDETGVPSWRIKTYGALLAAIAVIVLGGRLASVLAGPSVGMPTRLNMPFAELARQIERQGFRGGMIIAETRLIGGNLRQRFPNSVVVCPEYPTPPSMPSPARRDVLIVWDATGGRIPASGLTECVASCLGRQVPLTPTFTVEARCRHSTDATMTLGVILAH